MRPALYLGLLGLACVPDHGEALCRLGASECGGRCVVVALDPDNCGACGARCAAGEVCREGVCGPPCGAGLTLCDGACVSLAADPAHCGACAAPCPETQVCAAGACADACHGASLRCDDRCVDPASDRQHCGDCNAPCGADDACVAGVCAPACGTGTLCGDGCVDTQSASAHCGSCDHACVGGRACVAGACRPYCGADPCAPCAPWWSVAAGSALVGASSQRGRAIASGPGGEVVVAFDFASSLALDAGHQHGPAQLGDVAVAGFGPTGSLDWSLAFVGDGDDHVATVAVDALGNIFVGGSFEGTLTAGAVSLDASGTQDGFVVALSPSGTPLWGVRVGGAAGVAAAVQSISASGGAIFVGGGSRGDAQLFPAGGGAPTPLPPAAGASDFFVARLDAAGAVAWATAFGSPMNDTLSDVTAAGGRVFVAGWFERDVDSVPDPMEEPAVLTIGADVLSHTAQEGAFVAALADGSGAPEWARGYAENSNSDTTQARANAVVVDATGSLWLLGEFENTVEIDGMQLGAFEGWDGMLVRIDPSQGNAAGRWAFGRDGSDHSVDLAIDEVGRLVLTGYFNGAMQFIELGSSKQLASAGGDDVYLVVLEPPATLAAPPSLACAGAFGDASNQRPLAAAAGHGAAFVTGWFRGTLDLAAPHVTIGGDDAFAGAFGL
jgi:hypothetical protein